MRVVKTKQIQPPLAQRPAERKRLPGARVMSQAVVFSEHRDERPLRWHATHAPRAPTGPSDHTGAAPLLPGPHPTALALCPVRASSLLHWPHLTLLPCSGMPEPSARASPNIRPGAGIVEVRPVREGAGA